MNNPQKIEILDSTLRDGSQGEGISFSVQDKINVVKLLDQMGVAYIEAGNPGSNPKDLEFFDRIKQGDLKQSTLVAFGSTRRKGIKACDDANLQSVLKAKAPVACIFGKSWDLHVHEILSTTKEENEAMIEDTMRYLTQQGMAVFFDAEHFFDGYKANRDFALDALGAAVKGGAQRLVLCDTNGGAFPNEIADAVRVVMERYPNVPVGVHCHNDGGMAVANSIAAVDAGATHIQGTWLGFGERCGNVNLTTVIANLQLKRGIRCIPDENISSIVPSAMEMAEIANIRLKNTEPYIGNSAFAHKAGMHADGVLKVSHSFEHISPETVGNERRFLMSEQTGRTAVLKKIGRIAPDIQKNSPETQKIIDRLKSLEHEGYQFEGADASFELIVRKELGLYEPFFSLVSYRVLDEEPAGESGNSATATIKIKVDGQLQISAAEGDGPVHALDQALREALCRFYPHLSVCRLIDYKVRVMDSGKAAAARVRVLITSSDGKNVWTTVGVSTDVIRASWLALVDSLEYRLIANA